MRVSEFMTPGPVTVEGDEELDTALRLMERHDVRHLPVVEGKTLVGVLSDRDLLKATGGVQGTGRSTEKNRVRDHAVPAPFVADPDDSAVSVLVEVVARGIGCLPVVRGGELIGIVSEMDLLREFVRAVDRGEVAGSTSVTVKHLMTRAPRTVRTTDSIEVAFRLMEGGAVRHVPVTEDGKLVGILSDRDLRRAHACGFGSETAAAEEMTPRPVTVTSTTMARDAAHAMRKQKLGALPVVDDGELVGILTIPDLLDHAVGALRLA